MKRFLFTFVFSAFLIIGCADNPLMSPSPETEFSQRSPNQQKLILLPPSSNPSILNNPKMIGTDDIGLKFSMFVDGEIGGEFIIDTTYFNSEGRLIEVYVRLKFDPGTFEGTKKIIICPNPEDLSIRLFPHMTFNVPQGTQVKLDYIITGYDVQAMGYTHGPTDFVYFSNDGDIEIIQTVNSQVNFLQNSIGVHSAQLTHFSRYGWAR